MLVLIDNGHGENTPGKRSPKWADGSQLFEWQYAREVANAVYNQLIAKGVDCELLVKESVDVPLAERARRANEAAAKYGNADNHNSKMAKHVKIEIWHNARIAKDSLKIKTNK